MADTNPELTPPNAIDAMLNRDAPLDPSQLPQPDPVQKSYQVFPDSRIAVSKQAGNVWRARRDAGKRAQKQYEQAWNEAEKYYNNDQLNHRKSPNTDSAGNIEPTRTAGDEFSETENLVFSNTNAQMSSLYAKNPTVEFTGPKAFEPLMRIAENLARNLMRRKDAPGLNMKPKARRHVLRALLFNMSYLEIGYNDRLGSIDSASKELSELTMKLQTADEKQIKEIEGQLQAIETETAVLYQPGPWMRVVDPRLVIRDPESEEEDLSDANWVMIGEFMNTSWLQARFTEQRPDGTVLKFEPTHVVNIGNTTTSSTDQEINNFRLLADGVNDYKKYGFDDGLAFRTQCRTLVWRVWDRNTRRVMWFLDNDWSWPLWIWDDPLQLSEFFPIYPLSFHQNPSAPLANGEVSYYLDQQDAINTINSRKTKELYDVCTKIFYNSNILDEKDVEAMLRDVRKSAIPVDVPEDVDLNKALFTPQARTIQMMPLFDKGDRYQAIDRISGTSAVMRGGEFKTNTTNQAIETYNSNQAGRQDEKIDQIEDCFGRAIWGVTQLCLQKMDVNTVAAITGDDASMWRNLSSQELRNGFTPQVVAGSTTKPNTQAKKAQALEAGQVLGQFASNPQMSSVIGTIVLRMFSRAFDEVAISQDEWNMLISTMQAGGPLGMIDQLPPPAKQAFAMAVAQGASATQALEMIMQGMGGSSAASQSSGPPASATR